MIAGYSYRVPEDGSLEKLFDDQQRESEKQGKDEKEAHGAKMQQHGKYRGDREIRFFLPMAQRWSVHKSPSFQIGPFKTFSPSNSIKKMRFLLVPFEIIIQFNTISNATFI